MFTSISVSKVWGCAGKQVRNPPPHAHAHTHMYNALTIKFGG